MQPKYRVSVTNAWHREIIKFRGTWKRWSSVKVSMANRQIMKFSKKMESALQFRCYSSPNNPEESPSFLSQWNLVLLSAILLQFSLNLSLLETMSSAHLNPIGADKRQSHYRVLVIFPSHSNCPEGPSVSDWDSSELLPRWRRYRWVLAELRSHMYYKTAWNKHCCLIRDTKLLRAVISVFLQHREAWKVQIFHGSSSSSQQKLPTAHWHTTTLCHSTPHCQTGLLTRAYHCASRATQLLDLHSAHRGSRISLPPPCKTQPLEMFSNITCSPSR